MLRNLLEDNLRKRKINIILYLDRNTINSDSLDTLILTDHSVINV